MGTFSEFSKILKNFKKILNFQNISIFLKILKIGKVKSRVMPFSSMGVAGISSHLSVWKALFHFGVWGPLAATGF
jgi:hypothetical protein